MKLITKKEIVPLTLIILMAVAGFLAYNKLPEQVPSHWNASGEVDVYSSKNFAVFFAPLLAFGLWLLLICLPLIDPLRKNYQKFSKPYFALRAALVLFLGLLYGFTLAAGLGVRINIKFFIVPSISILIAVFGFFMPKIKPNWFVGIRTPWTLQSDEVWQKTHQFAGKTFVLSGLLSIFSLLFRQYSFAIFLFVVLAGALAPVAYSYFVFKQMGLFKNKK